MDGVRCRQERTKVVSGEPREIHRVQIESEVEVEKKTGTDTDTDLDSER